MDIKKHHPHHRHESEKAPDPFIGGCMPPPMPRPIPPVHPPMPPHHEPHPVPPELPPVPDPCCGKLEELLKALAQAQSDMKSLVESFADMLSTVNSIAEKAQKIDDLSDGCDAIKTEVDEIKQEIDDAIESGPAVTTATLTVVPTPSDAIVTINGVAASSITVTKGTTVYVVVSREGYVTATEYVTVEGDMTFTITLEEESYAITIVPTPSTANVTINGASVRTVSAKYGSTVSWTVSADGYVSQSGTLTVTGNKTLYVILSEEKPAQVTFTINATAEE